VDDIFGRDWNGPPFQLFGGPHLGALLVVVLLNVVLVWRFRGAPEGTRTRVRWILVAAMWTQELCWHLWNAIIGRWSIRTMLPLHLCSAMVWTSGILLLTRSRRLYPLVYFLGIGGALQALLTPDLDDYNFPHYRFFETFFAHTMIVTAAIFMTFVERFRPTVRRLGWTIVIANAYAVVVFFINHMLGSNYLFLNAKPPFPTLLDLLPPWPTYLIVLEGLALLVCLVLYAPWVVHDHRALLRTRRHRSGS
jgi:hypothetical integral membrane protein (TIGR02206 family)